MPCWRILGAGIVIIGVFAGSTVFAAHPLVTEDTGTQGVGNLEFENGLSRTHQGDASIFEYQPQLSYGLTPTLDLIAQPSWWTTHSDHNAEVRGWGDTNADVKWRFFGKAPMSWGMRVGVTLATGQHDLGLPHGKISSHALLVATYDAAPFTTHVNVGVTHNPSGADLKRNQGQVSTAIMWAVNQQLTFTGDAGLTANPDSTQSSWSRSLLAGAIYTIQPGLDADVGYQFITHATPSARQWLAGLTYRFAL